MSIGLQNIVIAVFYTFVLRCNQQIAASSLLVKSPDVTRSIVQKAVVVLASKPVFGPIRLAHYVQVTFTATQTVLRDKLGVVTSALFNQRDFSDPSILDDFAISLEHSLRSQLTESGFYMGSSLCFLLLLSGLRIGQVQVCRSPIRLSINMLTSYKT